MGAENIRKIYDQIKDKMNGESEQMMQYMLSMEKQIL
jgi:hypothetical protein